MKFYSRCWCKHSPKPIPAAQRRHWPVAVNSTREVPYAAQLQAYGLWGCPSVIPTV